MTPESQQWIERLCEGCDGQEQAITELHDLLLKRLKKTFRDRPDLTSNVVEDLVQDSLLKVLANLDSFAGRSQFTTWATTIAIRTAFSEMRRRQWKDVSLEQLTTDEGSVNLPDYSSQAENKVSHSQEMLRVLHENIQNKLTDKQREALLAELAGMPIEEIARRNGNTRNATYKLTHDARKRLKQCLEASGYTGEDWLALRA